ncbi:MAG: c-type cytochrome [Acidimicrobiia bacterium]
MARGVYLVAVLFLAACGGPSTVELTGAELATEVGCFACHTETDTDTAPTLHGIWGTDVMLESGATVTVDEAYVIRSIVEPGSDIVAGYEARMPVFPLDDSEVDRLVEYVRSLG